MIVRRFLLWARSAPAGHRAEAVSALARAYLYSDLSPDDRWEAETALTAMLDDRSPVVRRAMAESLAASPDAPRHVITALAADQSDIAEIVLAKSPLLLDCDLVDIAALGDERVQTAIARRTRLSAGITGALAEIGSLGPVLVLAANPGAEIADPTFAHLLERFGGEPALREALLSRPDLPVDVAQGLASELAHRLGAFVSGCGWLSPERSARIAREACERTTVTLSAHAERDDVARLVSHLRRSAQLTPALILRALLSGQPGFAEAAFADLARVPARRAEAAFRDPRRQAFRAIYAQAGLPASLRPAFEGALAACRDGVDEDGVSARLSRRLVRQALAACTEAPLDQAGRIVALLRRFEAEAALDEARTIADDLADDAALSFVMEHAPEMLLVDEPAWPNVAMAA